MCKPDLSDSSAPGIPSEAPPKELNVYRLPIAIFIVLLVFVTHNNSKIQTSSDSRWFVPTAMSIIREKNIDIDEYDLFIAQDKNYGVEEVAGHKYNVYPIGNAIIALPFVWMFDLYFENVLHLDLETALKYNPTGTMEKFIASLIVALTASLIFLIAERLCQNIPASLLVAFVFSFCTPAWSTASRALWQHGPSMLMLAFALYCFVRAKSNPRWIPLAGIPLAVAFTIRPTNIVPLVMLMLLILIEYRKYFIYSCIAALVVLVPFVLLNMNIYGSMLPPYYNASKVILGSQIIRGLAGNLISPNRGIFVWSPVLLFSIYGAYLKLKRKEFGKFDVTLAGIIVAHSLVISSTSNWWGGGSIGPRFFSDMLPFFMYFLIPAVNDILVLNWRKAAYLGIFVVFTAFSFFTHYRGANSIGAIQWIVSPKHIDTSPARVWDWKDIQFLRKARKGDPDLDATLILAALTDPSYHVKHLLDLGGDPEAKTSDGWTPLMMAAMQGHGDSIRVLLKNGADANAKNRFGTTPLMLGAWYGRAEVVMLLINAGADVNARNDDGYTALMLAAWNGQTEIVRRLIEAGADVNAEADSGTTAAAIAQYKGYVGIIRLLKTAGAKGL